MSPATLLPAPPAIDPARVLARVLAGAGTGARDAARVGGLVLGSLAAAAVVWLVLAGPGFMAHGPGPVRTARVALR